MAATGENDLLANVQHEQPDLIILDDRLPAFNIVTILSRFLSVPTARSIPVILFTQSSADRRDLPGGVDVVLTEPFNPKELLLYIRRLLKPRDEQKGEDRQ